MCGSVYSPEPRSVMLIQQREKGQSRDVPWENSFCLLSALKVLNTIGCVCCEAEQVYSYAEFPGALPKGGSLYLRFTTAV